MPQVFAVWGPNWPKRVWGLGHLPLWGACVGSVGHAKAGHFVTPVTCKKVVLTLDIHELTTKRVVSKLMLDMVCMVEAIHFNRDGSMHLRNEIDGEHDKSMTPDVHVLSD